MVEPIIDEKAIRLENELADELLACPDAQRDGKYTEVYEKVYLSLSPGCRQDMSDHYCSGAKLTAEAFLKIIGRGKKVLDIGCGFGHLSHYIALGGNDVIGIDVNRIHVREAQEVYGLQGNLEFRETGGVHLDFPSGIFNYVLSTSVFEHLHPGDVTTHLKEVHRVLESGGAYIFTALTPYRRDDVAMLSKDPFQKQKHGFHINERTWSEFQTLLEENGFFGLTDILPGRFRHRLPNLLVPIWVKACFERSFPLTPFVVRILRLDKVYMVARRRG
ncbi:MAG: class I SAM-dependent methyltransferase [Deltaproteobacteria bacterium]|nr:class I SAM-dependent methyltransferase [Deltaproteobacteria bacterium]